MMRTLLAALALLLLAGCVTLAPVDCSSYDAMPLDRDGFPLCEAED